MGAAEQEEIQPSRCDQHQKEVVTPQDANASYRGQQQEQESNQEEENQHLFLFSEKARAHSQFQRAHA